MKFAQEKAGTMQPFLPGGCFDSFHSAARKRGISFRIDPSGRTLVAEVDDGSFLLPFVGTHRVQRIPPNSTRRHTSTATVAILDNASSGVELNEADLQETFTRGTGKGGQNRNVHDHCVILTHVPSGIRVRIDERSQWSGRKKAREEILRRLSLMEQNEAGESLNAERQSQITTGERSAKTFTHNEQRDEVLDHQTGKKWRMSAFSKGRF